VTESYVHDFADDTAFERYVLQQAVPIVARDAGSTSAVYDVAADQISWNVVLHETVGMTLDEAVDRLGIRPLCLGAAWKITDLLVEQALAASGVSPGHGQRWTIAEKINHAQNHRGQAEPLSRDSDIWSRLMDAYAGMEQVRHSLVHRRADIDASNSITGVDQKGARLRPLTAVEQEDFCRAVLLAARYVMNGSMTNRERARLAWHLDGLSGVTGLGRLCTAKPSDTVVKIEVRLDGPLVDWPKISARINQPADQLVDIDLVFTGGERVVVHLEDAPTAPAEFDPRDPPHWAEPA